jgi:hypothetical protein
MATKKTAETVKKTVAKRSPAKKEPIAAAPKKTVRARKVEKSAKDLATEAGEPYVGIISIELDPENIGNGAFELDWNDKFIINLVKEGYQSKAGEPEDAIVDRWFQAVCRNVVQENFEQWEANQPIDLRPRNIDRRDLGDGRSEVS